jgi:hypothetical protein
LDEGAGLRRKFNYEEASPPNNSKKAKDNAKSSGGQIDSQSSPISPNLRSRDYDEAAISPRNHENASLVLEPRLMAGMIGNCGEFGHEKKTMPSISPNSFVPTVSEEPSGVLGYSSLARQNAVAAEPTPNETIHPQQPLLHLTESSLSDSVNSVFQNSASHQSTLSSPSPSERLNRQREEDNHFEVLFLMRHFAEVVGPWLVLHPWIYILYPD